MGILIEGITKDELMKLIGSMKNPDELLTHQEAMKELKIKRTQYKKLRDEGLIPVVGLGTLERVKRGDLHNSFEAINLALNA